LQSKPWQFVLLQRQMTLVLLTLVSCSLKYTTLEHYSYLTGVSNCHKGTLFLNMFWCHQHREGNLNTWTRYTSCLWPHWKEVVPELIPLAHHVTLHTVLKVRHISKHGTMLVR
jgi:hypothetical protein